MQWEHYDPEEPTWELEDAMQLAMQLTGSEGQHCRERIDFLVLGVCGCSRSLDGSGLMS